MNCLNVTLYYESLCGDSVRFIANQLYPNHEELGKYYKLEFIPYGKAVHSTDGDKVEFLCQHGTAECNGNKYQSCGLSQTEDQKTQVEFVNCVMRQRNPASYNTVEICATKYNLNMETLKECSNSVVGDKLLASHGDKTNKLTPSLAFVPTIVYDDKFDQTAQTQSLKDFAAVVCSKIEGNKPNLCVGKTLPKTDFNDFYF